MNLLKLKLENYYKKEKLEMSNIIQEGLQKVQDTEFIFNDRGGFEVRNAYIFWTNFRGEANKFGNSARNFNLAVTPEVGKLLYQKMDGELENAH